MKKDSLLGAVAGLIAGCLIYPTLSNLDLKIPYQNYLLFIALPLGTAFFVFLVKKMLPRFFQFAKFVVTGGLNFSIDFGVLNLLIIATSISTGIYVTLFKTISFIFANTNSYFWNKGWTFDDSVVKKDLKEYLRFSLVSIIGLAVNVGIFWLIVTYFGPHFGLSSKLWANLGAAGGSIGGLMWSYLGYKFLVFKD